MAAIRPNRTKKHANTHSRKDAIEHKEPARLCMHNHKQEKQWQRQRLHQRYFEPSK